MCLGCPWCRFSNGECSVVREAGYALQGVGDVAPRALGIRNTNAPAGKPPVAGTKGPAGKRGAQGTGAKAKSGSSSASLNAGPADDDDAGLAAGTLSKAEAEEKLLGLFGEGKACFRAWKLSMSCKRFPSFIKLPSALTVLHHKVPLQHACAQLAGWPAVRAVQCGRMQSQLREDSSNAYVLGHTALAECHTNGVQESSMDCRAAIGRSG